MKPSSCPAPEVLLAMHRARLSPAGKRSVRRHLRRCPVCAQDSRIVAGVLRDESTLIHEIRALLPERGKKRLPSRKSVIRTPLFLAAAAIGLALAFFVIVSVRSPAPTGQAGSYRADLSEFSSGPALAAQLFPKRNDLRDRWSRPAVIIEAGFVGPSPKSLGRLDASASFMIRTDRGRDNELRGWSLAVYEETDRPDFKLRSR